MEWNLPSDMCFELWMRFKAKEDPKKERKKEKSKERKKKQRKQERNEKKKKITFFYSLHIKIYLI